MRESFDFLSVGEVFLETAGDGVVIVRRKVSATKSVRATNAESLMPRVTTWVQGDWDYSRNAGAIYPAPEWVRELAVFPAGAPVDYTKEYKAPAGVTPPLRTKSAAEVTRNLQIQHVVEWISKCGATVVSELAELAGAGAELRKARIGAGLQPEKALYPVWCEIAEKMPGAVLRKLLQPATKGNAAGAVQGMPAGVRSDWVALSGAGTSAKSGALVESAIAAARQVIRAK